LKENSVRFCKGGDNSALKSEWNLLEGHNIMRK